ncbi:hypothetical protein Q7P37_010882 [Cladosporium fusiforme]
MTASFQAYDFLTDAEMTIGFVQHSLGEAKHRIINSHNSFEQSQQALAAANGTVANLRRLNATLEEQFTHLKNVHVGFDGFFRNMTGNLETVTGNLEDANDRNDALEEVIDDRNDEIHEQGHELRVQGRELREQTELVRLLNEQLAGLHEHQVQQFLLTVAGGQQSNDLLSSSVSSNIVNPTLACNNALIMNQRLRATIVYLRTSLRDQKKELKAATKKVDELQLEKDEIAYELQELDEITKAEQPSDFLLHLFPTVPMDTLSKVAAVLNSKDRELAAAKLALEQEKNFRVKAEEELATAMDGTCQETKKQTLALFTCLWQFRTFSFCFELAVMMSSHKLLTN